MGTGSRHRVAISFVAASADVPPGVCDYREHWLGTADWQSDAEGHQVIDCASKKGDSVKVTWSVLLGVNVVGFVASLTTDLVFPAIGLFCLFCAVFMVGMRTE